MLLLAASLRLGLRAESLQAAPARCWTTIAAVGAGGRGADDVPRPARAGLVGPLAALVPSTFLVLAAVGWLEQLLGARPVEVSACWSLPGC
jgi:hypothetical protein